MSIQDPISDMLIRIKNASLVNLDCVLIPFSKIHLSMLNILKSNGFISDHKVILADNNKKFINVFLKYYNGVSVIKGIKRISKPSCRIYTRCSKIRRVMYGLGIAILSTNHGIMTDSYAKKIGVGGEIICNVW